MANGQTDYKVVELELKDDELNESKKEIIIIQEVEYNVSRA